MARVNLTEHIWYNPSVKNYVMLDITDSIGTQSEMMVEGVTLVPKDEYHCSLVPAGKLGDTPQEVAAIIEDVRQHLEAHRDDIHFEGLGHERYLCEKNGEYTLIAPAIITGLSALRQAVCARIPDYQPPFPHVTLLKSVNSQYGIGINSERDLATYCRQIQ